MEKLVERTKLQVVGVILVSVLNPQSWYWNLPSIIKSNLVRVALILLSLVLYNQKNQWNIVQRQASMKQSQSLNAIRDLSTSLSRRWTRRDIRCTIVKLRQSERWFKVIKTWNSGSWTYYHPTWRHSCVFRLWRIRSRISVDKIYDLLQLNELMIGEYFYCTEIMLICASTAILSFQWSGGALIAGIQLSTSHQLHWCFQAAW
jgi:hypothetical protein